MKELMEDYQLAQQGRKLWLEIKEEYKIDELWYVAICPGKDVAINELLLAHLPDFLRRKFIHYAVIILEEDIQGKACVEDNGIILYFRKTGREGIEAILKYYRLMQFEKNIIVASLEEPYGTAGIIGKEGITLEDYVKDALLV